MGNTKLKLVLSKIKRPLHLKTKLFHQVDNIKVRQRLMDMDQKRIHWITYKFLKRVYARHIAGTYKIYVYI